MSEDRVEQALRAGLERRAERADASAPVVERVRASVRRRRRTRLAVVGSAAAVAALAVATAVMVLPGQGGERAPRATDGAGMEPPPTGWRTEYWHDLQVQVPADWGWGSAPVTTGGRTMWCGDAGALVGPDGGRLGQADPSLPYVGRPIFQSDLCRVEGLDSTPSAAYVWLGAPVAPGRVDLGAGFVRETREVNGSTVSVATRDAALRERILDSATGGETCLSNLDRPPRVRSTLVEGMGRAKSLQACAYRRSEAGGWDLVYAADLGAREAEAFVSAVGRADVTDPACPDRPSDEYVVLTATGDDPYGDAPVSQDYVVDLGCPDVEVHHEAVALTRDLVSPWASGGVLVTLTGPAGGPDPMTDLFIGMQG